VAELVILVGLPGAGKTTFFRDRFAGTHVHVSKDLMRNRRDKQPRQLALIADALAAGRSVVVDNVNATAADRAALVAAGRRHGAAVSCYVLQSDVAECLRRNRARTGRARVPAVAIHAAGKRWQPPAPSEGFDRLLEVRADAGRFEVGAPAGHTVFLLSPASTAGERGALLLDDARSGSPLAARLRSPRGVPLGEVYSFLSSLYFRGKLAYAAAFGRPPRGLCGAFVITPGEGLRDPAEPITIARLRRHAAVRIRLSERRYLEPLRRDAAALRALAHEGCRIVLLGSIASPRYVEPLLELFGERLLFPPDFVGRGDMSRGGLLLRCVENGRELAYAPVAGAVRHGPRPPRLAPRRRSPEARSMR
jgi:predicted kinase